MATVRLKNQQGLTIVEVLVAATVFMIGFSLLIAIATNSTAKFSTRELTLGSQLGSEMLLIAAAQADTLSRDTIVERSELRLTVSRRFEVQERLVKARVIVTRQTTNRVLADFCTEYALPEKP